MNKQKIDVDIIIVGAGIVGAALACALTRANFHVALLDRQAFPEKPSPAINARVSAITYDVMQWLEHLGVWSAISPPGVFRSICVADGPATLHFDSAELGTPVLGYIVSNYALNQALLHSLENSSHVSISCPVIPESLQFSSQRVILNTKDQIFSAKLLVGADGANSWVRQQCQFQLDTKDYQHTALVSTLQLDKPHRSCAYQQFRENDVLALLPLADSHQCSLVWSGEPKSITALAALSTPEFNQRLQACWGEQFGEISSLTPRFTFPLIRNHAQSYIQERVCIIGDAAHTLHPLAGQGLNMGLWDAKYLVECIKSTHQQHRDIGRYANLRPFERARQGANEFLLRMVGMNKWIFSQDSSVPASIRQMGLRLVDHLPWVKKKIMKFAVFNTD